MTTQSDEESKTAPRKTGGVLSGMRRRPAALIALVFVVALALMAIFAPWIAPYDPYTQDLLDRLSPPSAEHWLGTDDYGRDALSRLIFGARISLTAALQAVGLALVLGLPLGVIAGYVGGWIDTVLTRIMDALMSAPALVLAITIVAVLGSGITNAMVAVGLVMTPRFFRVSRASTMDVRHETYIESAVALGCRPIRVIVRHILPNVMPPVVLVISVSLGSAVAAEASLSFLGLGAKAPAASWGSMLSTAASNMQLAPYLVWPPGVMIFLAVLAFTYLGDGVRRAMVRSRSGSEDA
ncbi:MULTISPECIES: ABC transporter permease [unclassified Rhodococcus (in: high G+C Gram-positive bacteria)]|uniref:ABC transporter permease n=1 Tax=unclassified Rhodococcus (in: high G+C Gram-positive bacteria) TaxID=192944 RepID=UPI000A0DF36E|nr:MULTISPECIES: ABC transporter permease [unclassified Rhodococcus (in: high G+C Gram-positive bacteria)]ORI27319.1 diguanylate cyclase [Rhodococcus sp. 1168]